MPSPTNVQTVRDALILAVRTAWTDVTEVAVEEQLLPATAPWALVRLDNISNEEGGGRNYHQRLNFEIHGRWPYPDEGTGIEDEKLSKATALSTVLEASTTFGTYAFHPVADSYSLQNDGVEQNTYDLRVMFSCLVSATWGT